jgi:hypothetical protein
MTSAYFSQTHKDDPPPAPVRELNYQPLFRGGRGFSFPCDDQGRVNLDVLSARARNNYLFARAMVGRELAAPEVRVVDQVPVRWAHAAMSA